MLPEVRNHAHRGTCPTRSGPTDLGLGVVAGLRDRQRTVAVALAPAASVIV